MSRWIVVLAALALAGCATDYRGYGYHDRGPVAHEEVYVGGSSYYAPVHDDRGDYYYGSVGVSYNYPLWVDYPAYYSLFWPLHRSYVDPYWHPGFYYGVTYFPRNYFSVSLYGGGYRPFHSLSYSPYRSAWVDSYYDWYPHYSYYSRYDYDRWYAPRYGNARNEAERLARLTAATPRYAREYGLPSNQARYERGVARNPERAADYSGRSSPRIDPGVRGFERGVTQRGAQYADPRRADPRQADARGADYSGRSGRIDPGVRGFDRPDATRPYVRREATVDARAGRIDPNQRDRVVDRGAVHGNGRADYRRDVRTGDTASRRAAIERAYADRRATVERGYAVQDRSRGDGYSMRGFGANAPRDTVRPPVVERRGHVERTYQPSPRGGYQAPAYREAPVERAAPAYREAPMQRAAPAYREAPSRESYERPAPVERDYGGSSRAAVYEARSEGRGGRHARDER